MINSFNNFYNNLSSDSLFFFWIIVFLFILLVVISIILIKKNKKLVKILKEEQEKVEDNKEINNSILKQQEIEVPLETKKVSVETKEVPLEEPISNKEEEKIPVVKQEIKEVKEEEKPKENNLYQKNVLREISSKQPVSPIHIEKKEEYIARENLDNFDFSSGNYDNGLGMTYEDSNISPLEEMEDAYEVNDNMKFASEIVEKMEEEVKPSNIELTDYEKKQEEEAIISYDELMKVKDKIYNITDDEETDEFIDELKNFRLDL